jgi:hypothetical protein
MAEGGIDVPPPGPPPDLDMGAPPPLGVSDGDGCFVAGTLVATGEGHRPIEELTIGDMVTARDEWTGETSAKPVTKLWSHATKPTTRLAIGGDEIVTSTAHRFRVEGRGFVAVRELQVGDRIGVLDGAPRPITAIAPGEPADVYNLSIADFATFFVGAAAAWVHNVKEEGEPHLDDDDDEEDGE